MLQATRDGQASTIKTLEGYCERLAGTLEVGPIPAKSLTSEFTILISTYRLLNRITYTLPVASWI